MSESHTAPATGAPQPAAGGTEPPQAAPEGFTQVRTEEYQQTQRLADQARGQAQLITPLVTAGIHDPTEVQSLLETHQTLQQLKDANVDIPQLLNSLSGQPEPRNEPQVPAGGAPPAGNLLTREEFDAGREFDRATYSHDAGAAAQAERRDALVDRIAGANASEFQKMSVRSTVDSMIIDRSSFYPEGHPLNPNQSIMPITETAWSEVEKAAQEGFGRTAAAPADGTPQATIGAGGGLGPGTPPPDESTPFQFQPQDVKIAEAQRIVDETNGTTGSTL